MTKWLTLALAPLGAITAKNWILVWVFLEFSSMSFILLSKNKSYSESLLKYFLIQTLASIFIIMSISMKINYNYFENSPFFFLISSTIIVSLILKAGMAPLHYWMINISKNLTKKSLLLFLSIQKLAPISIIMLTSNIMVTSMIILLNSLIGTISQLYSLNLNLILTFSSISHSSWIILSGMNSMEMLFLYFLVYTIILSQILIFSEKSKTNNLLEMKEMKNTIILFLSLGGLPPLLGFFPKWLSISFCMYNQMLKIICFMMMIMACLNIFIYLRIFSMNIMKTPESKKLSTKTPSSFSQSIINLSPLIMFFMPKL